MDGVKAVWRAGRPLGAAVRAAREQASLTQAQLARRARVGLKFLYELESGKETLRADKVLDVLAVLSLQVLVTSRQVPSAGARQPPASYAADGAPQTQDYIRMACTTASVSMRENLTADELVAALMTGKLNPAKHAHFIVLLEEAPRELLRGLVGQVGAWAKPGTVAGNLRKIAAALHVRLEDGDWLKAV